MARRNSRGHDPGQEMLRFDGPPVIHTETYDIEQAREAAVHRRKRKDELALNIRTQGFMSRVNGLWVPHSGLENTAVVSIPDNKVRSDKRNARDRVLAKYEDSDVSPKRALLWAYFAAGKTEKQLRDKFSSFIINGQEGYRSIHAGLVDGREIDRTNIENTDVAIDGILSYLMYLRTFVGAPGILGEGEKRKWPQKHHHHVISQRKEVARDYLDRQTDYEFTETVKEAYYSERSRHEYWKTMRDEHEIYVKRENERYLKNLGSLPLEAYVDDPHADDRYYVDGDYIG